MDMIIWALEHRANGLSTWVLLPFFCLCLLYVKRECWKRGYRLFFAFVIMISVLFFCPLFANVMARFLPGYPEYERVLWLWFTIPLMAYVLVELIHLLHGRQQMGFIIVAVLLLFLTGNILFTALFKPAENSYKINQDAVALTDKITADLKASHEWKNVGAAKVRYLSDSPELLMDTEDEAVYYGMRQKTAGLTLEYTYVPRDITEKTDETLTDDIGNDAQYLICHEDEPYIEQIASLGYTKIGKTGTFAIFKNRGSVTIFLVQNGETEANATGILEGCGSDSPLTEKGKKQAEKLGESLSTVTFSNVYTSALGRTQTTAAAILAENHRWNAKTEATIMQAGLNDISWGNIDKMKISDAESLYGPMKDSLYFGSYYDTGFASPFAGETAYTYCIRMNQAISSMVASSANQKQNILVVAHPAARMWLQKIMKDQKYKKLDNASLTILRYNEGRWKIVDYNDTDYDAIGEKIK